MIPEPSQTGQNLLPKPVVVRFQHSTPSLPELWRHRPLQVEWGTIWGEALSQEEAFPASSARCLEARTHSETGWLPGPLTTGRGHVHQPLS